METERANLCRIVLMASEEGFVEQVWQLAEALATFLFQRGYHADAKTVHTAGLAAATTICRDTGDVRPLLGMHAALGTAYYAAREHTAAVEQFEHAARLAARLGDDPAAVATLAKMFVWKGLVHRRLGQPTTRSRHCRTRPAWWPTRGSRHDCGSGKSGCST